MADAEVAVAFLVVKFVDDEDGDDEPSEFARHGAVESVPIELVEVDRPR